jgi:hypothetical protein
MSFQLLIPQKTITLIGIPIKWVIKVPIFPICRHVFFDRTIWWQKKVLSPFHRAKSTSRGTKSKQWHFGIYFDIGKENHIL